MDFSSLEEISLSNDELELLDEIARLEFHPRRTNPQELQFKLKNIFDEIVRLSFFRGMFALVEHFKQFMEQQSCSHPLHSSSSPLIEDEIARLWKELWVLAFQRNRAMFDELNYILPLSMLEKFLTQSIKTDEIDLVRMLLAKTQIRVTFQDLCLAKTPAMANVLLQRLAPGVDIHQENDALLHHAAFVSDTSMLEYWMDKGLDINAKQSEYILHAIQQTLDNLYCPTPETVRRMRVLLKRGARPNADQAKMLRTACKYGWKEIVEILLDNGADIHVFNGRPLELAAREVRVDIVALLLQRGARPADNNNEAICKALDAEDATVYDPARPGEEEEGRCQITTMLLDHGADPNAQHGLPLLLAVAFDYPSIVRLLLHRGARVGENNHRALRQEIDSTQNDVILKLLFSYYPSIDAAEEAICEGDETPAEKRLLRNALHQRVMSWYERQASDLDSIVDVLQSTTLNVPSRSASSRPLTRKRVRELAALPSSSSSSSPPPLPSSSSSFMSENQQYERVQKKPRRSSNKSTSTSTTPVSASNTSSLFSSSAASEQGEMIVPLPIVALRDIVRRHIQVDWVERRQKIEEENTNSH